MANKLRVYVAGPIGAGNIMPRVETAIEVGEQVATAGFAPFIPHLLVFWSHRYQHDYEFWMAQDFAWLGACDACLRMSGASPGADREVAWCEANGVPVFRSLDELIAWRDREVAA